MSNFRDLYIIRWLLQNTEEPTGTITWQRRDYGMYFANFYEGKNRVHIEAGIINSLIGGRVDIKFTSPGLGEVHVQEPYPKLFSKKYESEDDGELAKTMRRLLATIGSQHAKREIREIENEEERRQAIFQRLISGGNSNA